MTPDIDAALIAPEIVLVSTLVAVFIVDLILGEGRKAWVFALGVLGCVGSLGAVIALGVDGVSGQMVDGAFVLDPFSLAAKGLLLGSTALVLALGMPALWKGEYCTMMLAATLGALVLASSRDLVLFVVAFETLAIPGYLLVAWDKRTTGGFEGALKYYLLGVVATAVMLYGVSLLFGLANGSSFSSVAAAVTGGTEEVALARIAVFLVIAGMAFKISAVPFHFWAPDAYQSAPIPVAAYLSVVSKIGGMVGLVLLTLLAFPAADDVWVPLLWVFAVLTMTVGNLAALRQTDSVRLLAYSSIAQAGYMLVPLIAIGHDADATANMDALIVFLVIYAVTNIGAFAALVALVRRLGSTEMNSLRGAFQIAPVPSVLLSIFVLSLAGIPPFGGWFAKLVIFQAGIEADSVAATALVVVAALNSVLALAYYAGILRRIWLDTPEIGHRSPLPFRPHLGTATVMGITVLAVVMFGVLPGIAGELGDWSSLVR